MNPTDTDLQHLSVKQFYIIGIRAVIFGILVIFLLNLASRLQSLTRSLNARIIISADTVACLPPR